MTPDQFRTALADLGLSQVGFARLAMVDARTVRRWCDGTRAVPGPVVALLRLCMTTLRRVGTECPLVVSPLAPGWRIDLTSATPQGQASTRSKGLHQMP
jgi:hypothetical protein